MAAIHDYRVWLSVIVVAWLLDAVIGVTPSDSRLLTPELVLWAVYILVTLTLSRIAATLYGFGEHKKYINGIGRPQYRGLAHFAAFIWVSPALTRMLVNRYSYSADDGGRFTLVIVSVFLRYAASSMVHGFPFKKAFSLFIVLFFDRVFIYFGCLVITAFVRGWEDTVTQLALVGQVIVIVCEIEHFRFRWSHNFDTASFDLARKERGELVRLALTLGMLIVAITDMCLFTQSASYLGFLASVLHFAGFFHFPRDGNRRMHG